MTRVSEMEGFVNKKLGLKYFEIGELLRESECQKGLETNRVAEDSRARMNSVNKHVDAHEDEFLLCENMTSQLITVTRVSDWNQLTIRVVYSRWTSELEEEKFHFDCHVVL